MSDEKLKKFVDDQTEAVKIAREEASETSNSIRSEAVNMALCIASYNKDYEPTSFEKIKADALKFEQFLRERK